MSTRMWAAVSTCAVLAALGSAALAPAPVSAQQRNPKRDAYFGETHVHTSWSFAAFAIGNLLTTPGDAYKYFKGEPIKHPLGYDVKIDTPLDWAGVTDHSEYAGVVQLANEPGSPVSKICRLHPWFSRPEPRKKWSGLPCTPSTPWSPDRLSRH